MLSKKLPSYGILQGMIGDDERSRDRMERLQVMKFAGYTHVFLLRAVLVQRWPMQWATDRDASRYVT